MTSIKKTLVIGLDGLEPTIVEPLLQRGELPNLARLREQGGYSRVATTLPAQTPVAWSTFATGTNPGAHGVFDFLRRDPKTYLPQLGLNHYEQKNPFTPPRVVNDRRGVTIWELLSKRGTPSVVIRCPCTYPPDDFQGRLLSGMGVPDVRGSLGTSTFYTSDPQTQAGENESVITVDAGAGSTISTELLGPLNPKTRKPLAAKITVEVDSPGRKVTITCAGGQHPLEAREREWSDWLRVKFKAGLTQSVWGMVRFYLVQLEPVFELYCSPVNFTPESPPFAISSPADYATQLESRVGTFYTTGMVEDHMGLENGRIDEASFLEQCEQVWSQREAMLLHELDRVDEGLLFCLFDTPDRVQHMFWRFRESNGSSGGNGSAGGDAHQWASVIEEQYKKCDQTIGKVMDYVDDETMLIVLSDHGFGSFNRGVHLNTWLFEQGLLALQDGLRPSHEAGDFLRQVDWDRTQAYALGLGGIYLNRRGREAKGIVDDDEAPRLKTAIREQLGGLEDPERQTTAVRSVADRDLVYHGELADRAPDLLVKFGSGYRASWETALGGVPEGKFADNTRRWSGDHIVDPALVPGVLFMNRTFREGGRLLDLAPTILEGLGAAKGPAMEGESLLI